MKARYNEIETNLQQQVIKTLDYKLKQKNIKSSSAKLEKILNLGNPLLQLVFDDSNRLTSYTIDDDSQKVISLLIKEYVL